MTRPDDFATVVDCTEAMDSVPELASERAVVERLLARRDTLREQISRIGPCPESASLRKRLRIVEARLRERGVEGL